MDRQEREEMEEKLGTDKEKKKKEPVKTVRLGLLLRPKKFNADIRCFEDSLNNSQFNEAALTRSGTSNGDR